MCKYGWNKAYLPRITHKYRYLRGFTGNYRGIGRNYSVITGKKYVVAVSVLHVSLFPDKHIFLH